MWETDARNRTNHYFNALNSGQPVPPVAWVLATGNSIPANAIEGGREADGQPLFIARVWHENGIHVGKVARSWASGAHISFGGREVSDLRTYEILVGNPGAVRWHATSGQVSPQAIPRLVEGGYENSNPMFIAQASHNGGVHVGKAPVGHNCCYIAFGGKEIGIGNYSVLVLN
nr:hypothetical protein HK105_005732 [Polyrhizophydium stewartii]